MKDTEEPHRFSVSCINAADGCKNSVSYVGTAFLRKLCPICQESGTPSERILPGFNFETEARRLRHEGFPRPKIPLIYSDSEAVYEITARPRTLTGGRVLPCPTS